MKASQSLRVIAMANAAWAWTGVPLLDLLTNGRVNPRSVLAFMSVAVIVMVASLVATLVERRTARNKARRDRFLAGKDPRWDMFATSRREAHDHGLPWVESDGSVSWPPEPKPTAEQVHADLHRKRMQAEEVADLRQRAVDATWQVLYGSMSSMSDPRQALARRAEHAKLAELQRVADRDGTAILATTRDGVRWIYPRG